jgi:NADH-quinone oxidoreductase subunit C
MSTEWVDVPCADWHQSCADAVSQGFSYLDVLTGIDRGDGIEVLVVLCNPADWSTTCLRTRVSVSDPEGDAALDTVTDLFPAASWYERETSEMFGVIFTGLADSRPLLRRELLGAPPLLKSVVLAARVAKEWPGGAEPSAPADGRKAGNPSKRRQRPAGVPADWWEQP